MVAPIGALSIQASAIRVCRLNDDGSLIYSSMTGAYANSAFATLDVKPAIETANEFTERSADGEIFINYRDDDKIKWLEVALTVQYPDPELMELMENGALLLDSSATIGYEAPELASTTDSNPCSLEVWTKCIQGNVQTGSYKWMRWLLPFTRGWHRSDISYSNNPEKFMLEGFAMENPNFGIGPFSDWTADETSDGVALDSTRSWEWIFSTALPTPLAPGYLATPAAPT